MNQSLDGKICLVTGAGRGLGRAMALSMASEGAKMVINDLGGAVNGTGSDQSPADEVVAEIMKLGGEAVANYDTVGTITGGENIIKTAITNFGQIDVLVNNAGVLRPGRVTEMTEDDWDTTIAVHLKGTFCCSRSAGTHMIQQGSGSIINISSGGGVRGVEGGSNYSAAKAGILGFTRAFALELKPHGVRVNALLPRAYTRMMEAGENSQSAGFVTAGSGGSTLEDIAALATYLAGDEAATINGLTLAARQEGLIEVYSNPLSIKSVYQKEPWTQNDLSAKIPNLVQDLV